MTTAEPLPPVDQRESYIGGSDAAAILGLDQYRTRLDVYQEKTGEAEPFTGNWSTQKGSHMESLMLQRYLAETGYSIGNTEQQTVMEQAGQGIHPVARPQWAARHAELPYLGVHADAVVRTKAGKLRLVEFKTTRVASEWRDGDAPDRAVAQVHHGAMVLRSHYPTEIDTEADIYADIGERSGPVLRTVDLTDKDLDWHLGEMVGFWEEHVQPRVPPEPTTEAECARRWPGRKGTDVIATEDMLKALRDYNAVYALKKDQEEKLKHLKVILKAKMGDAVRATSEDGKRVYISYPVCKGKRSFSKSKLEELMQDIQLRLATLRLRFNDPEPLLEEVATIVGALVDNCMVQGEPYRQFRPRSVE